jgi:hypothetical protein
MAQTRDKENPPSIEDVARLFNQPIDKAAKALGVGQTWLKYVYHPRIHLLFLYLNPPLAGMLAHYAPNLLFFSFFRVDCFEVPLANFALLLIRWGGFPPMVFVAGIFAARMALCAGLTASYRVWRSALSD